MSSASSRCPSTGLAFPSAGPMATTAAVNHHRFTTTEGSFVRPQPTPRVRYANRVPLYDEANDEDEEEWNRLYGLFSADGGTVSAATSRRLSPIRAFGQNHRRTASLDNIIDGMGDNDCVEKGDKRAHRNRLRAQPSDLDPATITAIRSRPPPCWSPHRFAEKLTNKSTPTDADGSSPGSAIKTKWKSISDKYLKNPVAGMVMNGRDTLTSSLLNRIRNKHPSPGKDGHVQCEQDNTSRSSFRSFSCSTLPSLDDVHRKRLVAANVSLSPSELADELDSPGSPIVLRGEGDSDSGIVPEWSDTSSISESSYIRHYQPCQLLSSWRKPQPKVRRSLSPIFQYRTSESEANTSVDQVDSAANVTSSSTSSSAAYETIWPSEEAEIAVPEHQSILSSDVSNNSLLEEEEEDDADQVIDEANANPVSPVQPSTLEDAKSSSDSRRIHTTRIHIEYPPPIEQVKVKTDEMALPSRPSYSTASLDRRALSSKPMSSDRSGASVHLIKIERDATNLKAELGIFIAKKKLAKGSVGYLVAHIVPGGLVDR